MFVQIAKGQGVFQKTFGTSDYEEIWGMEKTTDGGFILGGYTGFGDAMIIKLNINGDTTWTKKIDLGGLDLLYSIQQTKDLGFIAAGRTNGFGAGGLDILLIKLDYNGAILWTKAFGGTNDETINSIKQTLDGGFIAVGNTFSFGYGLNDFYIVKTDSNGNIIWNKSIGGSGNENAYSVVQTVDSNYVIVGFTSTIGAGDKDVFITKLSNNGNIIWMKSLGGVGDDRANSIQNTYDNGFIISGVTDSFGAGNYDFYLIKIDSVGNNLFQKTFGGVGNDWSYCVQQTSDFGYILAGYTLSFGAGNSDYYVIKTDTSGNIKWAKTYGGSMNDYSTNIKQTSDYGFAVLGYGQSFGAGNYDFYIVKTDSIGNGLCNQNIPNTITYSVSSIINNVNLTTSSGGMLSSHIPIINSGVSINTLCKNTGVNVNDNKKINVMFYPNPLINTSIIKIENNENIKYDLYIFNIQGQLVNMIENILSGDLVLKEKRLVKGLYIFKLISEKGFELNGKLIIE